MPVNSQLQTADIVHVGGFELSGGTNYNIDYLYVNNAKFEVTRHVKKNDTVVQQTIYINKQSTTSKKNPDI